MARLRSMLQVPLVAWFCQGILLLPISTDACSLLHSATCVLTQGAFSAVQVETAVALWRRMPEAGVAPTPGTLATVLRACRIALQGERALSLLAEARAAGALPAVEVGKTVLSLCCLHIVWSGIRCPVPSLLAGAGVLSLCLQAPLGVVSRA